MNERELLGSRLPLAVSKELAEKELAARRQPDTFDFIEYWQVWDTVPHLPSFGVLLPVVLSLIARKSVLVVSIESWR